MTFAARKSCDQISTSERNVQIFPEKAVPTKSMTNHDIAGTSQAQADGAPNSGNSPSPEEPQRQVAPDNDFRPVNGRRRPMLWTASGFPIVDGKYLDLDTGEVTSHDGRHTTAGPPSVAIFWHNRYAEGETGVFSLSNTRSAPVTEILVGVGKVLEKGNVTVASMCATTYSVNVIVETSLSLPGFKELLREQGLVA
jgi:hypothetical protein